MVLKIVLLSDEEEDFVREINIDSEDTFLDLQNVILDSVGYSKDQMTSFFICNDYWEKEQDVLVIERDTSAEDSHLIISEHKLDVLL